jgi:2-polyprenyl-3-methyl-5-hydroxy-6-metoxy-1,4-benzoquinol methylase
VNASSLGHPLDGDFSPQYGSPTFRRSGSVLMTNIDLPRNPSGAPRTTADGDSVGEQIARNYYATTASRGHSRTREHYDSFMTKYGRRLVPWLPADKSTPCIDLACGCGEWLYSMAALGYTNLSGVDLSSEELDEARYFVRARLDNSDVLEFLKDQADGSFGFVSALNFLEHIPKDRLPEMLRQVRRVLRPGGTLVAIVPNAMSPFASVARYWDITHELAFSPNSVRQLAALTGFSEHADFAEVGPILHGVKSAVRWTLWRGLRAAVQFWLIVEGGSSRATVFTQDMMFRLHKRD